MYLVGLENLVLFKQSLDLIGTEYENCHHHLQKGGFVLFSLRSQELCK